VFSSRPPLQRRTPALGKFDALAQLESVEVGDDDLGAVDFVSMSAGTSSRLA
jgi:hypothetical protein